MWRRREPAERLEKSGAGNGTRTRDPLLGKPVGGHWSGVELTVFHGFAKPGEGTKRAQYGPGWTLGVAKG